MPFSDRKTLERVTQAIIKSGERTGIDDEQDHYKLVVAHPNYQAAQEWLLEDQYERVKGQLSKP